MGSTMIGMLRRCLTVRALLLLASPALGGTLLPAIHPCPVDMPWLAAHAGPALAPGHAEHAGHHAAGANHAPLAGHHGETCHCIGSCLVGAAVAAPEAGSIVAAEYSLPLAHFWPAHDASLDLAPPASLLPPSTAPPKA
jgi:hypothetical protein